MSTKTPRCTAIALAVASVVHAQLPQPSLPSQVGITYPIVACKMPSPPAGEWRGYFPEAFNRSLAVNRGTTLVLVYPDGSEHVIFNPANHGMPNGSCVDPCVSFDGTTIYFAVFRDPRDLHFQRGLPIQPSHIWRLRVTAAPPAAPVVSDIAQLTFGTSPAWQDTSPNVDPQYSAFDLAPLELPDGRILFLSTRDGSFSSSGAWNSVTFPAPSFWRMNADGSNMERMEGFSQAGCQHPFILMDGRIVWTHTHDSGRRQQVSGNYPLMVAAQDLSEFKTFAGPHHHANAWHFGTQLSDGDIVVCTYYHGNNFGHGPLLRFPVNAPGGAGTSNPYFQNMDPISQLGGNAEAWNVNEHFPRIGDSLATPWSIGPGFGGLGEDEFAPFVSGNSGPRVGKSTMPAGAPPTGPTPNLLFVYSAGGVNAHRSPPELPGMTIAYAAGGTAANLSDVKILKSALPSHHYLYPKPLTTYQAIYGRSRPKWHADKPNTGGHATLPAGSAFATTGTSSAYNRESEWPTTFTDDWDVNVGSDHALRAAHHNVGTDSFAVRQPNGRWQLPINDPATGKPLIHAAQVVADMARVDTYYQTWNLSARYRTHNNGRQIWGILGEIPVRKTNAQGQTILDPQGNPDTSYEVRIPAMVPFHHRIIDENGMMLTAEWTWHSTRPGERKNDCGGCHAHSREKQPLQFSLTQAGQSSYQVTDFALKTPVVDRTASGKSTVTTRNERIWVVEYFKDVKPILDAKCARCHTTTNPAGGLDLQSANAWSWLAHDATTGAGHPVNRVHQATRWVRKNSARQSMLAWKIFGARLDGRNNSDRGNDVDFAGTVMPPAGSTQLTFMEKRTIATWIDLGCLVDVDGSRNTISRDDPFDDHMRPTLVVSGIESDHNESPLPPLKISAYDLHSGVKANSLTVRVNGTPLTGLPTLTDGGVVSVTLPTLAADQTHAIEISVADNAPGTGNIARRQMSVTPRGLRIAQTPLVAGTTHTLTVSQADPGTPVFFYGSTTGVGSQPCAFGLCLDLDQPILLGSSTASGSGIATWSYTMPNAPGVDVVHQAGGFRAGVVRKTRPIFGTVQ